MPTSESIGSLLQRRRIPYLPIRHRLAYSAQKEAAAAHVRGRQWAKTVVCFADEEPLQAVVSADRWVDLERLRVLVGAKTIRLGTEAEMVRLYPSYEPGAIPPFGTLMQQRVVVDRGLVGDPEMVFPAGSHTEAICMHYNDFAELVRPEVGTFAVAHRIAEV
jgi:Ala-tRNA(Pro) deacylase